MKSIPAVFAVFLFPILFSSVLAIDNSFKLDFDGDGGTDIALYREGSRSPDEAPQQSFWYFLNTRTGQVSAAQWGRTLDVPMPADFDNDGITDPGVFRWWDFETGDVNQWWLNKSTGGHEVVFLEVGYQKFNRNYIGDGRAELAQLYQINISPIPNNGCFISIYLIGDFIGNTIRKTVGDTCNVIPTPIPGDYDNDGRSEIAVYDNRTFKVWLPPYQSNYTPPDMTATLDVEAPAPGDYDGDGKTDFAGTRGQAGRLIWVIRGSASGIVTETDYGFSTDKPVPGDYDADGITDLAVFRTSDTTWWIRNSSDGSLSVWSFGYPTDTPLAMPVIPFDPTINDFTYKFPRS
jgi:hypothetical protein